MHSTVYRVTVLDIFAELRKVTLSFVMSVCPSTCPHGTVQFSLHGFS